MKKKDDPNNPETNTGTGFLTTKKSVPFGGYSSDSGYAMPVGYNISKHVYDQFALAMDGKPAQINAFGNSWIFDTNKKTWTQSDNGRDMGSTDDFRAKGFQIQDPDFIALTGGANETITLENQNDKDLKLKSAEDNLLEIETSLRDIFMKEEEFAEGDLQKMFKPVEGYTVKQQGGDFFGYDSVAIYDKQDNFIGSYGMDFTNPKRARNVAKVFYKKFGPEGLNVLDVGDTTNIINTSGY